MPHTSCIYTTLQWYAYVLVSAFADLSLHHSCYCFGLVLCIKCEGGMSVQQLGMCNMGIHLDLECSPELYLIWTFQANPIIPLEPDCLPFTMHIVFTTHVTCSSLF